MPFRWWKSRRRRSILAKPCPPHWLDWLEENVLHYRRLDESRRSRLVDLTRIFVAEKNWEGLEGLTITDEVKLTIAAQACLMLLGRDDLDFDHVLSILVYPDMYLARNTHPNEAGIVSMAREARLGEAWYRGPVILSWQDALADARQERRGYNVVLHEFAHQLDMLNGRSVDGVPPLAAGQSLEQWRTVMNREFQRLGDRCRHRRPGLIDCYGAQNAAEFFAVITETFFEQPLALQSDSPDLFDALRDFYQLDPSDWSFS